MTTLPVRDKYLIADTGMYLTVDPSTQIVKFDAAAPGAWEEVEILASHDTRYVLVRFCAANCYLRVDTVLWLEKKYHEAIQTYPPDKPDVDSGWQQAEPSGHTVMFRGPDVEHRVGYTAAFRTVNKDGSDFR